MSFIHLIVLAVIQGITEFLPISSSGHLVLVPRVIGWPDQGLAIDVAVHVGSLLAVMTYFFRDILSILKGVPILFVDVHHKDSRLVLNLLIATAPILVVGGAFQLIGIMDAFRSISVIGATMLGFGILLYVADKFGMTVNKLENMRYRTSVLIGLSQVLALIPGTSRAGISITAARLLGYERYDAARFSMLMAIPAIAGAGTVQGYALWQSGDTILGYQAAIAALLAFVSALVAISAMMAWLRRASFTPFAIYRVILGSILLVWACC